MINQIYQLTAPRQIETHYRAIDITIEGHVIVKPDYLALCHADQRYYLGKRPPQVLAKKLPMALIHECCARVIYDPSGTYQTDQRVVLIPNQPPRSSDDEFFENYMDGTHFLSSGYDGFLQEFVQLPLDRVVPFDNIPSNIAAISEFLSVSCHAFERFDRMAHSMRQNIAIFGDGSLGYVTALVVKRLLPQSNVIVIGRNDDKLALFSFVDETIKTTELTDDVTFDHAFECCGGDGSEIAINDIIRYIKPQGTLMLMGVSENKVSVNTRDVLEKGLTLVGSSRSGRVDFEKAIELLTNAKNQALLAKIVYDFGTVQSIAQLHQAFAEDSVAPFKTAFHLNI